MKPGRLALTIVQGATFRRRFIWKAPLTAGGTPAPRDLTGYKGRAQVRINSKVALTFDSDPGATRDGTIIFGAQGTIDLAAASDVVARAQAGSGFWSLEVQAPGNPENRDVLLTGTVTIVERVTR